MSAERRTVDRRKQVLEAATRSFATFGYKATTMDQVAKVAGVGKGTIYTFFANKEELFGEILSGIIRDMRVLADETIDPSLPFADNLMNVLNRLLDYRQQHYMIAKLSQEVRDFGTPMAQEGLDKMEAAIVAFIARHVEEAIGKGEIRSCDPDLTAYLLLKSYLALTSRSPNMQEPLDKEALLGHFRFYWMEGLAVR